MKFRNSLFCSLAVFVLMLLLLIATKVDSYSWDEPTTDVEYRLRGTWVTMGWLIAIAVPLITFICLMLLGWVRTALCYLVSYLNKSAK
jgi:hypothetical protein